MSVKVKSLSASEEPIGKIFDNNFLFKIPDYQRPYSWKTEQALELITDIQDYIADENGRIEDLSPYFLGSIVLIQGDTPEAEVVDGQQRLTTLTIIFSILRALIKDEDIKKEINGYLLQAKSKLRHTSSLYRLQLRASDKDFFEKYIQDADKNKLRELFDIQSKLTDSQLNIQKNAQSIYKELEKKSEEHLTKITEFIIQGCYLVVVVSPEWDSAYRIFSVMNDRGLDLTTTDILKADIIGAISEDKRNHYTNQWQNTEDDIGREQFSELFSHIRMIFRRTKLSSTVVKEFREYVLKRNTDSEKFIKDTLLPYADAYKIIINNDYTCNNEEHQRKINQSLQWLNKINNSDWVAPAMQFISRYENLEQIPELFHYLERLASCLMILRYNVNERIKRYAELLEWAREGKNFFLSDSPIFLNAEEKEEVLKVLNGNIYKHTYIRLILLRLDSLLSEGSAEYRPKTITVEHVLPQVTKSDSIWSHWIPEETVRNEWVDKLANLVLLSRRKNSEASNFDFEHKKEVYFKSKGSTSPFILTNQVREYTEWTEEILQKRQQEYLDRLAKEWELN